MVIVMQSYSAARSLFTFLAAIAWCAILGGALLAFMAAIFLSQFNTSFPALISGTLPGIVIALFGFLVLVQVQMGRASVDSAEFGQQALQVARDQLAFAKQVHFETSGKAATPAASSRTYQPSNFASAAAATTAEELSTAPTPQTITENGPAAIFKDPQGNYRVEGKSFDTLEDAQKFIETASR